MAMLSLPDVTLVSVDTVCHELTKMAVGECTKRVDFGDIKIFTNDRTNKDAVHINPFNNLTEAGNFTVYELPSYIETSHCLFIHYDSWVIDPGMWSGEFLCDYIGAPWWYKERNVGNSGFAIRSLELMEYIAARPKHFPIIMPEDNTLCRQYRPKLEEAGFIWARDEAAQNFSFERVKPAIDSRHFGFHGMFNWPFVLSYDELNERMAIARKTPYLQGNGMLDEIYGIWVARWGFAAGIHRA